MRKIIFAAALALSLAGCASLPGPLGDAVRTLTTTINNPVGPVDIYRVKNTYAAALEVFVEYRRYCWSVPYRVLLADPVAKSLCSNRRAMVRALKAADEKAFFALSAAENFVANNPTLNAASAISAAWQAVTGFQSAIPAKKG